MLSNPCLFPALEQGNRRKAKGSMWRVCSKDVEMNHFNQLTFQPGNQTCLWLWVPWGTPFFPQEFSLSPFLCISECDLYLRADRFRTGFVWSHILAPVVVRGRWRVIGSASIFGGFFYCATALSLQTKWMGPRAAGLRGVVATSSGWLVWSGFHEMGYFISQTSVIIMSNKGVYSCEAISKLHWKMHRMCGQQLSYKIKRSSDWS